MMDTDGFGEAQSTGTGSQGMGEDEIGGLISFANLENVVKHIIRKFKAVELRNEATDEKIRGLKTQIDLRATTNAVEETVTELEARIEHLRVLHGGAKESITSLETSLERNRVMATTLEKRLEATVKEKAVQDRLIRETQEALQDKVAVAELNMFEAKFAGYTTKLELQEVVNSLGQCARIEHAERIAESVRVLGTQFDDYSRTAKIGQQFQELRDWVTDELQNYARLRVTNDRIEDLQQRIGDQAIAFERAHSTVDDKLRALSDRVTSMYTELKDEIYQRALADDLKEVRGSLKRYALKADTDAFEQDTLPKLRFCVESIKDFDARLRTQSEEIQHVDEVLLDKAAKYDIVVVSARIEQCIQKEAGMKEFQKLYERLERINQKFEDYKLGEAERLEQIRPPDYGPMIEKLELDSKLKADRADLVEMYQLKANRIDADELARLQDIIHRQLEYLTLTTFYLSKLTLTEAKQGEAKTIRSQQKAQVLMQSEALWHWILHNEQPPNMDSLRPHPPQGGPAPGGAGAGLNAVSRRKLDSTFNSTGNDDGGMDIRRADETKRLQLERRLGVHRAGPPDTRV